MIQSLNDWTSLVDEKKDVDVIYFDFAKAFDRVSHSKYHTHFADDLKIYHSIGSFGDVVHLQGAVDFVSQ
ncbi:hypothetical protein Y032_0006g2985 [Ancylostoma ceylanicum]|uniref:Reverse transcriptase domain-containing protein n=1 Tax=Ancylostoma ceylanicum TaxID=53326 RepID=A0A016VPW9_9BILA|nr:hypothetical protein Y032_0006g2985 [Ancylostoma ceylanicum]